MPVYLEDRHDDQPLGITDINVNTNICFCSVLREPKKNGDHVGFLLKKIQIKKV